jgi:hypothetical protein
MLSSSQFDPERKSRSDTITLVVRTGMYCPALSGSFAWGLQQLVSQFVVAGVALCHIFQRTTLLETWAAYHPIGREKKRNA